MASSSFLSRRNRAFAIFCAVLTCALSVELSSNSSVERDSLDACQSSTGVRDSTFIRQLLASTQHHAGPIDFALDDDGSILSRWRDLQSYLISHSPKPGTPRPMKLLVAQAVAAKPSTFKRLEANMNLLAGEWVDSIKWAVFHYDGRMDAWEKFEWYRSSKRIIVRDNIPRGRCKQDHFRLLKPETVAEFDFIWVLDDDIDLRFWNWELYSHVLAEFSPLVTQPAILVASEDARTTSLPGLAMQPVESGKLVVVSENGMSEVMAPVISTKVWPALRHWISRKTGICDSDVSMFWDIVGILNKIYCKQASILVVNVAPVSHVDCRSNTVQNRCWHECGDDELRTIDREEAALIKQACPRIADNWLEQTGCDGVSVFECARRLRLVAGPQQSWSIPVGDV
eukprot:TRINITY_DN6608_c0_g2_i1.p1 TRINITY_DN6608_c0_g2~~TRINITY_DN6608_c0_g2_i1.p1  ORF type:complete len:442 (-),score=56.06 TRINITY_DN6608_c0_g2_i1:52-1245(-)